MSFTQAAQEITSWASANVAGACAIGVGFVAVAALTVNLLKPYFACPTPTPLDDSEIRSLNERNALLLQKLNTPESKHL